MARIRIVFKGGLVQDIEADEFRIRRTGEEVTQLDWNGTKPRIMFIALPEIAAVFELEEKKGWFG